MDSSAVIIILFFFIFNNGFDIKSEIIFLNKNYLWLDKSLILKIYSNNTLSLLKSRKKKIFLLRIFFILFFLFAQ